MRILFCQCWSKLCKIRIKSFGYKEGIFNLSAINQSSIRKSCVSFEIQKLFNNNYSSMYVSMHTHIVCKYACKKLCMYVCMYRPYHCFKIKKYEFFYNAFHVNAVSFKHLIGARANPVWSPLVLAIF